MTTLRLKFVLAFNLVIYSLLAQPNIIYHNGQVVTMNPVANVQQAIAIEGEKIAAVGTNTEILAMASATTAIINLNGRTLMPGFVDAHSHLLQLAANSGESLDDVQQNYFENGITTVGQLAVDESALGVLTTYANSGKLRINLNLYLLYNSNCNDPADDWFLSYPVTSDLEATMRIAGIKIFTDGGTCGTIAALTFEYPAGGYGDLFLTETQLDDMLKVVNDNGYQAVLHAQGDAAVNMSLDALEKVIATGSNPLRHRIDHNSFIDPVNMGRYGEIGIPAVIFGHMNTCVESNGDGYTNYFGAEHISWLENWRLMHDENPNLKIGWHSDAPSLILDPIRHMASYVTRKDIDEDGTTMCDPPAWLSAHAITIEETLTLMTMGSAYTLNRETSVGSLETGKYADFVFLSDNPLAIDPDDLFYLQILGTMSKGEMVYCQNDNEDLCNTAPVTGIEKHLLDNLVSFYPNPTNKVAQIVINLPRSADCEVKIMDMKGHQVYYTKGDLPKGQTTINWDTSKLPYGIYLLQTTVDNQVKTKRIAVIK